MSFIESHRPPPTHRRQVATPPLRSWPPAWSSLPSARPHAPPLHRSQTPRNSDGFRMRQVWKNPHKKTDSDESCFWSRHVRCCQRCFRMFEPCRCWKEEAVVDHGWRQWSIICTTPINLSAPNPSLRLPSKGESINPLKPRPFFDATWREAQPFF